MKARLVRRTMSLAIAMAMGASLFAAPMPASAANPFYGGPVLWGSVMLSDSTPVAIRYAGDAASGLAPNTTYRIKVRLCPGPVPSGTTNRGFTWNPVTSMWVQERDTSGGTWAKCATVTTDARGQIPAGQDWLYASFGDELSSGTYYLLISLSGGQSDTFNASHEPTVTVLDTSEQASWVHNGIATGVPGGTPVTVVDDASSTVLTVVRTEPQGCDDDSNGIVDDEDYGPAGRTGDFRVGVRAGQVLRLKVGDSFWPDAAGFTSGPVDTDIALGASDMTPPTAPGIALASTGDAQVTVSWGTAVDDNAVTGYRVYRWTAAPQGAAWSPVHTAIATVSASQHSFTDVTATNGTTYFYEVRAVDAATNVGPRGTTASATPHAPVPTAQLSPTSPDGDNGWYVTTPTVSLTPSVAGRLVQYSLEPTPATWLAYTTPLTLPVGSQIVSFREFDGAAYSAVQTLPVQFDPLPPVATVSAPTWSVTNSASRTFTVSWTGTDPISGVPAYEVDYRTGTTDWHATPWRPSTMATSTTFAGSSGQTYYFRIRAIDGAGNYSPYMTSVGTSVPYDQTSASYSSGWRTASRSGDFLGSYRYATSSGRYLNFRLSRGTLYLVANTGPKFGKAAVYFRGRKVATIDTYSRTSKVRQVFKLARFSGSSASMVKVVNLGTYRRSRIEIDGFIVR